MSKPEPELEWLCFQHGITFKTEQEYWKHMNEVPHTGAEWPLLYYLKGITGVSLIEYEGKKRYLPTIIVEAMKRAKRPIKEIAWAPSLKELKLKGY